MLEVEFQGLAEPDSEEIYESGSTIYFRCLVGYHLRKNGSMYDPSKFYYKCVLDDDGLNANWQNPYFEKEQRPACESKCT